jgi:DNA (cytosine-5)-methyltransferase 1
MNDDETWVEGDHANTLNSFDAGDVRTTHAVLASFYSKGGSQQGFAREDHVSPTLTIGSGVGIASSGEIIAHGVSASDDEVAGTLCTNSQGGQRTTDIAGAYVTETFPIDDGRDLEKHQNGTGIGAAGDPAYTIDRQQRPAVAHVSHALTKAASKGATEGGTKRGTPIVADQMSVRRLTPTECERLMGWPDGWTAPEGVKAPDSKRYAACGDGIVAPVAFWIADRIRMIEGEA